VARRVIVEAGYPEFRHGLDHGLGRALHDGGTLLGPRWPCYGTMTSRAVEPGNVFTLELGVETSASFMGLDEDVLVTEEGCTFLSSFQQELLLVDPRTGDSSPDLDGPPVRKWHVHCQSARRSLGRLTKDEYV
jgi:Xaa-Pro aminopeptidase